MGSHISTLMGLEKASTVYDARARVCVWCVKLAGCEPGRKLVRGVCIHPLGFYLKLLLGFL